MALADIVDRILADAGVQADRIRADAAGQAEAIVTAGRLEAAARTEAALAQSAERLEVERNIRLSGVRREARTAVLALKRDLVNDIFVQVEKDLVRRSPEEYAMFLATLVPAEVAKVQSAVEFGRGDLARIGTGWHGLVGAALARRHPDWRFTLSEESGDFDSGLRVRDAHSVHDLSLEMLFEERRTRWEVVVAKVLFAP